MNYITEEQMEEFFSILKGKYYRDDFYNLFLDYLEEKKIIIHGEEEETELEQNVFSIAKERGFVGYDVICEITDMEEFKKKFSEYSKQQGYYIFHFAYELPEEDELSTSSIWKKWNQLPPLGWVGSWCSCGHFYPNTFEMAEMDVEEDTYTRRDDIQRPRKIYVNEVEKILFCSDNFIRIFMNDGATIIARPYKLDRGLPFKFAKDPLAQ